MQCTGAEIIIAWDRPRFQPNGASRKERGHTIRAQLSLPETQFELSVRAVTGGV